MNFRQFTVSLLAVFTVMTYVSCSDDEQITRDEKPCDFSALKDKTTSPGDNFYRYCNGAWCDAATIAEGEHLYTFLRNVQNAEVKQMFNEQSTQPTQPLLRTLRDDYARRKETAAGDFALIRSMMDDVDRNTTMHDLMEHAGRLLSQNVPTLVTPSFYPQYKAVKCVFDFSSNQMPDLPADSLLKLGYSAEEAKRMCDNTKNVIVRLLRAGAGYSWMVRENLNKPQTADDQILESARSKASRAGETMDNISYIAKGAGLTRDDIYHALVLEFGFYPVINAYEDRDLQLVKDYMKMTIAQGLLQYTSDNKSQYASMMSDDPCLTHVLGKIFADKHHTAESKQYVETMCENIRQSLINRIGRLDWMVDNTKRYAAEKVADMQFFCCYPENWNQTLLNITVSGQSYLQDQLEMGRQYNGEMLRLCGHTDRDALWDSMQSVMPAYIVNACYIPGSNVITITGAISTAPLVDISRSDAYNYGTIASIIGHEMTHGLDSDGSKYDKDGHDNMWWTLDDILKFKERQQQLVTIYNNLLIVPGVFQDGENTLGENIADLGGVLAAYDAFVALRKGQGYKGEELNEQKRMMLEAFASVWREKRDLTSVMEQQNNDVHANAVCRVNGVVCNHPEWYMLYDVRPNHMLYLAPERRVSIW